MITKLVNWLTSFDNVKITEFFLHKRFTFTTIVV